MSFAALFPGQGSQFVGMGSDLFDLYPELLGPRTDDRLGWSLRALCLDGPEERLTRTEYAQPALFCIGYALWLALSEKTPSPAGAAGHSLGEYTALAASGVIDFDSALEVVARRGKAMARAADAEESGMAAVIGADLSTVEEIVGVRRADGGRLQVANINAPGQIVVAGGLDDMEWLAQHASDLGARRAIPLKVAGAFHSSFMESAGADLEEALAGVVFGVPAFPVWSNTTARPHLESAVAETLVRQVVSPVRFSESLEDMAGRGIGLFVHVGPGDVTAGMARRTLPDRETLVVSDLASVDDAVERLVSIGSGDDHR